MTVRNIITSMRMISDVDWTELFERISFVDDALAGAGAFPEMDFSTRNLYRSAIEELARGSDCTEIEIAHLAVLATKQATDASVVEGRRGEPGYHLLSGGRAEFEAAIGFRAEEESRSIARRRLRHDVRLGERWATISPSGSMSPLIRRFRA